MLNAANYSIFSGYPGYKVFAYDFSKPPPAKQRPGGLASINGRAVLLRRPDISLLAIRLQNVTPCVPAASGLET